ncbi:TetR/AcrR family transcriptional regulator, partial [Clostridiaceae bacterium HSG29]|nr:TetR/AcrR family transcriptional regulator [Clostridiaceae bacterium HSG29]
MHNTIKKNNLKKYRTMKYFIDAAITIVNREGIEKATIRNIATEAGYNSATIYNYFNDLDHLIFFTKISNLEEYTERLFSEIPRDLNS